MPYQTKLEADRASWQFEEGRRAALASRQEAARQKPFRPINPNPGTERRRGWADAKLAAENSPYTQGARSVGGFVDPRGMNAEYLGGARSYELASPPLSNDLNTSVAPAARPHFQWGAA
jgi:hypothetical protein